MSDSRTKIWFALFVLAIFGFGLATGLVIGRRLGPPPREAGPALARGPMMPGMPPGGSPRERLAERLDRVLDLSDEQRAQVESILKTRGARLADVQREVAARAEQEQREMQDEIRAILDERQQDRFERWLRGTPRGLGGGGRGTGRGRGGR
jgi:hypothetical protein